MRPSLMSVGKNHRFAHAKQSRGVGCSQLLLMIHLSWQWTGNQAQHLPECQDSIGFFSVPAEKFTVLPFNSSGSKTKLTDLGFDARQGRQLFQDFGVLALLGAVPLEVVDAVRRLVLEIPKSDELDGLKEPTNRRQTLLSLSDANVQSLMRHAVQVLRPFISPLVGSDATLVEFAAITARSGALSQNAHADTITLPGFAGQQVSQLMQVQVMLQDTDKHMGPLNILPRSHRCTPPSTNSNYMQAVTALTASAGSIVLYDSSTLHFGGEHTGGADRVTAVFSFMQGLSANLPPARGSTFALDPALWGRYTLASLPEPCINRSVPKWQYEQFANPLHLCSNVFGNASLASKVLDEIMSQGGSNAVRSALAVAANESGFIGVTPLDVAAMRGHVKIAEVFISRRAELTASSSNSDGEGPLHYAGMNGHDAVVKLLLAQRAHVDASNRKGEEALHLAASHGHMPILKTLLRAYADIEDEDRRTSGPVDAMGKAAVAGHVSIVRSLIQHGISIHAFDSKGMPILFSAVGSGHLPMVKLFVSHGAEMFYDLAEFASSLGHDHVAQYIEATIPAGHQSEL